VVVGLTLKRYVKSGKAAYGPGNNSSFLGYHNEMVMNVKDIPWPSLKRISSL
jgi:hypothetical protein